MIKSKTNTQKWRGGGVEGCMGGWVREMEPEGGREGGREGSSGKEGA